MKKSHTFAVLAAATLSLLLFPVAATSGTGIGTPGSSAQGGVSPGDPIVLGVEGSLTFSAHIQSDGTASGYVTRHFPGGEYAQGHVTCAIILGNQATIGVLFEQIGGQLVPGGGFGLLSVQDNGEPSENDLQPDLASMFLLPLPLMPPFDVLELGICPPIFFALPVESGNVVVNSN